MENDMPAVIRSKYAALLPIFQDCKLRKVQEWLRRGDTPWEVQGGEVPPGDCPVRFGAFPPEINRLIWGHCKLIASSSDPAEDHSTEWLYQQYQSPRSIAVEWIFLLNELPNGSKVHQAAPSAIAKAMLGHHWCRTHTDVLWNTDHIVGRVGCYVTCGVYTLNVSGILATIEGGSRLIQRALKNHDIRFEGVGDDRFSPYGPVAGLFDKCLRYGTLDDVKRLLHVSSQAGISYLRADQPHYVIAGFMEAAYFNVRRNVFTYAIDKLVAWSLLPPVSEDSDAPAQNRSEMIRGVELINSETLHTRGECRWRIKALIRAGIVDLDEYMLVRRSTPQHVKKIMDLLLPKPDDELGLRSKRDGGMLIYLNFLALAPTTVIPLLRRLIRGDWWNHVGEVAWTGLYDDTRSATEYACFNDNCKYYITTQIDRMLGDRRFLKESEQIQNRAVTYILSHMAKSLIRLHFRAVHRYLRTSDGCGCPRYETKGVGRWFNKIHRRWPNLDHRAIYQTLIDESLRVSTIVRMHDTIDSRLVMVIGLGGRPVLRMLCQHVIELNHTQHLNIQRQFAINRVVYLRGIERVVALHLAVSRIQRLYFKRRKITRAHLISGEAAMLPPMPGRHHGGGDHQIVGPAWPAGSTQSRPPPAHASPLELAWYCFHGGTLAVKADGILHSDSLPDGIYPPPGPFGRVGVRAEVVTIKGRKVLLVFDLMGTPPGVREGPHTFDMTEMTLWDRMELLRGSHGQVPPWKQSLEGYKDDETALEAFVDGAPPGGVLWWPKWVLQNLPLSFRDTLSCLSDQPETRVYSNDGWILVPNVPQSHLIRDKSSCPPDIKVKPGKEVTVDLCWSERKWSPTALNARHPPGQPAVDGGGPAVRMVWRCYWDASTGGWAPREPRPEKANPNPSWLVKSLEKWHLSPWSPKDLLPFIENGHYRQGRVALSAQTAVYLQKQRTAATVRLTSQLTAARVVLDVGCGRGSQWINNGARWVGIDRDPLCIFEARRRGTAGRWEWADVESLANPLTGEPVEALTPAGFDAIIAIHSMQSAARTHSAWANWGNSLTRLAAPGAVLCISFTDAARLFDVTPPAGSHPPTHVTLPDGSWVRLHGGGVVQNTYEIKTSLAWAASALDPVFETYPTPQAVADLFGDRWLIESVEYAQKLDPEASGWNVWRQAECHMVLRKR